MLWLFARHLLRMSSENFIFPAKTCSDSVLARQASSLHAKSELNSHALCTHTPETPYVLEHSDCRANMPEVNQARQESFLVANTKKQSRAVAGRIAYFKQQSILLLKVIANLVTYLDRISAGFCLLLSSL
jgi:hypothetical protein